MVWALMTDPITNNIGLYDEPVATGDFDDPNSARNAPLNDPEGNLAQVYWHIQFDNMEVLFDTTVTVNHGATSAGTATTGETPMNAPYDADATMVDHDAYTHSAGYVPFVLAAVGSNILVPGYPVQTPGSPDGAGRYITPYCTSSKVFLHEYRTRGASGLSAVSVDYRLIGFRQQRAADGNVPPRLIDFDPATGLVTLGDGRWRNDRRYLQVVPGGSPLGLPFGRTLELDGGAFRLAKSDGSTFDPVPNTIKQGIYATGGTFASDTLVYGSAMDYGGSWSPAEILQVQAP